MDCHKVADWQPLAIVHVITTNQPWARRQPSLTGEGTACGRSETTEEIQKYSKCYNCKEM
ncbi:hypothetical protein IJS77_03635 [bacterium]|nr:hypothetical protein [bacterium]